jgi:hypothetical protein
MGEEEHMTDPMCSIATLRRASGCPHKEREEITSISRVVSETCLQCGARRQSGTTGRLGAWRRPPRIEALVRELMTSRTQPDDETLRFAVGFAVIMREKARAVLKEMPATSGKPELECALRELAEAINAAKVLG